jgi:cytochrome c peroxidase
MASLLKNRRYTLLGALFLAGLFISSGDVWQDFLYPRYFPKPYNTLPNKKLDSAKIALGRKLFYDPNLSLDNGISCASCHSSYNAFAHTDHALSHGLGDSIGQRNAPALFNLAWQTSFMWDGAIKPLERQALAPIQHPKEMGESLANVLKKLNQHPFYKKAMIAAYGDSIFTTQKLLQALLFFELSLISANSKYDRVMQGLDSFTLVEQKGYALFKKHCNTCHTEPLFFKNDFENNGLAVDSNLLDLGRYTLTWQEDDRFRFKIPSLRNLAYTYPYMHDGRFKKLSEVLQHYQTGGKNPGKMTKKIRQGMALNSHEKVELLAFLQTLNDKSFVFNPQFQFPK